MKNGLYKLTALSLLFVLATLLAGCYYSHPERIEPREPDETDAAAWLVEETGEIDSTFFRASHHYWKGFNFEATDTMRLEVRPPAYNANDAVSEGLAVPSEAVLLGIRESMFVNVSDPLVVADIMYVPADTTDSVWVKVARDQHTQGWVSEKRLMASTVADAPISKFINFFSDQRTIIFISVLGVFIVVLILTMLLRRRVFAEGRDEDVPFKHVLRQMGISAGLLAPGGWRGAYRSFYPTLLCLTVAAASTLYCSIQHFVPATWVEYYFHPTLNPFSPELPPIMQLFVGTVWLLVVVTIAMCIELFREEESAYVFSHIAGVACVCILIYLVITITIPIYIGYPLVAAYGIFAVVRYLRRRTAHYRCGLCGAPLEHLGTCPHCGAENK